MPWPYQFAFTCQNLMKMFSYEYRDLPELVKLLGCVSIQGKDLMDMIRDRKNEAYKVFLHHMKQLSIAKGIIVNNCMDVEQGVVRALEDGESIKLSVYLVGPLVQTESEI